MAIEKSWEMVGPVAFTATGTDRGVVTVTSTLGFKVKMIVVVNNTLLPTLKLEVKRVLSQTQMVLGPPGRLSDRQDLSIYDNTSFVFSVEQSRNSIPLQEIERATYEEEPIVAWRVLMVDPFGTAYGDTNPIPIEATMESRRLTDKDDDPDPGDIHDAVRIGNGTTDLEVNNDGSINVNIISSMQSTEVVSTYNEVLAVASGVLTTLNSYTVPALKTGRLQRIVVNGENIANYTVFVNADLIDRKRTYFSGPLNENFEFDQGYPLEAADVVTVQVIHNRPDVGDFGARIQVLQIG